MKDTLFLCHWRSSASSDKSAFSAFLREQNLAELGSASIVNNDECYSAVLIGVSDISEEQTPLDQIRDQVSFLNANAGVIEMGRNTQPSEEGNFPVNGVVITLLSEKFSADAVAETAATLMAHRLEIKSLTLLSPPESATAVQFKAQGLLSEEALSAALDKIRNNHPVDLMLQKDDQWRTRRRMICFDMDSTLIKAEVIDELAKRAGVGVQVASITERAMRGELDFKQSFAERMALLNGLSEKVLESVANELALMDGVEILFHNLHIHGFKTAILSGGFNYFAKVLQSKLGIDYVYANSLDIEQDRLTGKAIEPIIDGQAKASLLVDLAAKEGLKIDEMVAVGDGANDLAMLGEAGMGVAFRAKPLVRGQAEFSLTTHGLDGLLYLLGHPVLPTD